MSPVAIRVSSPVAVTVAADVHRLPWALAGPRSSWRRREASRAPRLQQYESAADATGDLGFVRAADPRRAAAGHTSAPSCPRVVGMSPEIGPPVQGTGM